MDLQHTLQQHVAKIDTELSAIEKEWNRLEEVRKSLVSKQQQLLGAKQAFEVSIQKVRESQQQATAMEALQDKKKQDEEQKQDEDPNEDPNVFAFDEDPDKASEKSEPSSSTRASRRKRGGNGESETPAPAPKRRGRPKKKGEE